MDEMTREEMQRFLNREAEKGTTEYEALKALAYILGITFPELKNDDYDIEAYKKALEEYKKDPVTYSHEEVAKMLEIEKMEDEYDLAVAKEAYQEYLESGCKSTPVEEFWKELDLDDEE